MSKNIIIFAHNIRSMYNVGSLFRSADCFGVEKIYLSGYTGAPPSREISKTAIGAEKWISWEKVENTMEKINELRESGYRIISLEIAKNSKEISTYETPQKMCLILGNEILGVPDQLLSVSDDVLNISMHGKKESLNVSVAAGIALYCLSGGTVKN